MQTFRGIVRFRFWGAVGVVCLMANSSVLAEPRDSNTKQDPRLAILSKYMDATQIQQAALRGVQMEVDIDAELPRLKKAGRLRALRKISRLGKITYKALGFSGDNTVKQEVISRYLAAESEARENGTIAITSANYKFRYAGRIEQNHQNMQVIEVTPRKKIVGLFKGEIWIDTETGMPVRESGQLVKSPSVFLKKIVFVRDYELRDGVAIPSRIQTTVETRVIGKAQLLIHFMNYARDDESENVSSDDASDTASAGDASGGTPLAVLKAK
jgi:hypothetical protein